MDKLSFMAIYPEIFLLVMASVILLVDVGSRAVLRPLAYYLSLFTLAVVSIYYAVSLGAQISPGFLGANEEVVQKFAGFGGTIVSDAMANALKLFASIAVFATLVYGRHYAAATQLLERGGEFFVLALFMLLGLCILVSAGNMLTIYLGLELLSLSTYGMVAMKRDNGASIEAAIKYFVLGCIASGFLLFGISLVYGATGHLNLQEVFMSIIQTQQGMNPQLLVLGLVLIVTAIGFKFSAVPFHMWAPDVYEGAPKVVTLLIAGASKFAAFGLVLRLLVEGLAFMMPVWQQMTLILAVASLLVGNLAAIAQTNVYRMLAFSTIAHIGFIFLGFSTGFMNGDVRGAGVSFSAALFYTVIYVLGSLAAFGVLLHLGRDGKEVENIQDLAGLAKTRPFMALTLSLALFSFAGVPPLVGFFAKFGVLQPLLASGSGLYIGVGIFAVMMALIGCFYYLRVVKIMYFDAATGDFPAAQGCTQADILLGLNALLLLGLGLAPDALIWLCAKVVYFTLGL
ncbi:MAG: NADH-quinone oxidoreductase subunit NuoN [Brachymonas sp.]|jgi:NADH-quinone oxidoreductase subunit N